MNIHEFDDHDWEIWAGCESPRPLRCESKCHDGTAVTIIIDGSDVTLYADANISGNYFSYPSEGIAMLAVLSLGSFNYIDQFICALSSFVQKH